MAPVAVPSREGHRPVRTLPVRAGHLRSGKRIGLGSAPWTSTATLLADRRHPRHPPRICCWSPRCLRAAAARSPRSSCHGGRRRTARARASPPQRRAAELEYRIAELSGALKSLVEQSQGSQIQLVSTLDEAASDRPGGAHRPVAEAAARAPRGDRRGAEEHRSALRRDAEPQGHPLQQAGARRLWPGAHGGDHPRRAAVRRLCLPGHA